MRIKIIIGVATLIGVGIAVWLSLPKSHKVIIISDISTPLDAGVRAPVFPLRTGALYVLYEGSIDADARIEVRSNQGRDTHTIDLQKGNISGVYGGAEHWVDDFSIHYNPMKAVSGQIKIGLYCGTFTDEAREWHQRLIRE
jgi:hypothetical protein